LPILPERRLKTGANAQLTEQLVFDLAASEPQSFSNFLRGSNAEALATLDALAAGRATETGILLWGAPGSGKTHLLRAAILAAEARGAAVAYVATPDNLVAQDAGRLAACALVAIDEIDSAPPDAQSVIFTLFNGLKEKDGHLLAAASAAPASLPLREDLRTRLAWGLVYEIAPLSDADKAGALSAYAEQRGFRLGADVIGYLLAHGRRDMPALLATLSALDRQSLAAKRPITVPMLRDWLQRDIELPP
jgi:DnaA family protein